MDDTSDESLMENFTISGNNAVITKLFNRHYRTFKKTAYFILRSDNDAADAAQECFIRIARGRNGYKKDFPFKSWAYSILKNCCIDLIRSKKSRGNQVSIEEAVSIESGSDRTPETVNMWNLYQTEIKKLSATDRMILSLRLHNSLSFKEIAEIANLTEDAARKRAYRALTLLRERILK